MPSEAPKEATLVYPTVESVKAELEELTKTYREKKRHFNALLRALKDKEA